MSANNDAALACLREVFGYEHFRPLQAEAIAQVMQGGDALLLMPTGGGKSLCYQVPALLLPGVTLVVSPLIALMQDQVDALAQLGVGAGFLNSMQTDKEQAATLHALRTGSIKLLYLAPERLSAPSTRSLLQSLHVSLVAIDEAHCVSQWGHDFRPDYRNLGVLTGWLPGVPRIALTATATRQTRQDIVVALDLAAPRVLVGSFDRPNIHYTVSGKRPGNTQLTGFLAQRVKQCGIIYCLSRKKVEATAENLRGLGFNARPYHAGLDRELRMRTQREFLAADAMIVVATIAFGMGIDKPDVRFVVHLDLPKSVEAYYQETGRAGRDGEPASAMMLYGLQDVVRLQQMMAQSSADDDYKRIEQDKLNALLGWCESAQCRRQPLLAYFDDVGAEPCGNCDNCELPPETWDATQDAQKLLSCIYRTGQRFGAAYVIDVLRGSQQSRIVDNGHDSLSVFGIGADTDVRVWRSLVRRLLVEGYLFADPERYGALTMRASCKLLLRGQTTLFARKDLQARAAPRRRPSAVDSRIAPHERDLWDALRARRTALAQRQGIAPFMIFHDATLLEIVKQRPQSEAQLLEISGVGQSKLDRYGDDILSVVRSCAAD
ncbi:MAG: DNA helicase RecQ [Pseudomonadota bacterium]